MALQLLLVSANGSSPGWLAFCASKAPQSLSRKSNFNVQQMQEGGRCSVLFNCHCVSGTVDSVEIQLRLTVSLSTQHLRLREMGDWPGSLTENRSGELDWTLKPSEAACH